jgi:hypothetical protein
MDDESARWLFGPDRRVFGGGVLPHLVHFFPSSSSANPPPPIRPYNPPSQHVYELTVSLRSVAELEEKIVAEVWFI